jgi:hypothetical protein
MGKPKLDKTYSTFGLNDELKVSPIQETPSRASQIRRDTDTIKTPACTIYDVDYAIMHYLQKVIKPQVPENNKMIDVPLLYASGEKWSQIQKHGYMRDGKGKLMTPLMTLKRNTITERDTLKKLDVNINPDGNAMMFKSNYTKNNQYDQFSVLRGVKPSDEYYVSAIPEYVDVTYELFIWCEYIEQLNKVIEEIMPTGGFAWGDTWKFNTYISDYTFDTLNDTGQDRVVRATLPLTAKATLLMSSELHQSTFKKAFSIKRITFTNEETAANDAKAMNVSFGTPKKGYPDNTNGNFDKTFRRFDQ